MNESMWDKRWDAALFAKWDKTGDVKINGIMG